MPFDFIPGSEPCAEIKFEEKKNGGATKTTET